MDAHVQRRQGPAGWVMSSSSWGIGHFRCRPGSRAWIEDNQVGGGPMMVFPNLAVHIAQADRPEVVASPNCVVFYEDRQRYRRRAIDPRGDDCIHYHLPSDTWRAILGHVGMDAEAGAMFTDPSGPAPVEIRLRHHRLMQRVHGTSPDPLEVEEELLCLAQGVVEAYATHKRRLPRRPTATVARHRDAVRALEEQITKTFRRRVPLHDLSAEVGLSPFHAARLFRRYTGMSMHAFRDHLRLREALVQLSRHRPRLDVLALELGYASHSHFTDRFRRAFGVPPSVVGRFEAAALRVDAGRIV